VPCQAEEVVVMARLPLLVTMDAGVTRLEVALCSDPAEVRR
jgi:hypothetical protein